MVWSVAKGYPPDMGKYVRSGSAMFARMRSPEKIFLCGGGVSVFNK